MSANTSPAGPRGVLLVHGAWHSGRAWHGVAAGLRTQGVPVAVAELHRGSLAGDVAAAEAALDDIAESSPVVACGHSYGGAVISGLPPRKVAHLVYLAAMMPDVGETSFGLLAQAPPSDLGACMIGDIAGTTTIDPTRAGELFHGRLDTDRQLRHVTELVPQVMAAGHQAAVTAAWRSRPSTYVRCTDDRVIHPELQRRFTQRATHTVTWHSDHGAFASHESDTVALLSLLARL
ncbi:alpha/beta hydrolase [Stenotrophomonas sp. NPDC087984]